MKLSYEKRKSLSGYVFLSPWLIGAIFFLVFPFVFSLILSFSEIKDNDFAQLSFIGFANFKRAFVSDVDFLPMFYETIIDTVVNTPMIVIFSLLMAIFLNCNIKGRGFFRSVFFLPVLLGAGYVMQQLLGANVQDDTMQLARQVLIPEALQQYLGPEFTGYINTFFSSITMVMWGSGVQIIILLAGLQGISSSLYEAARVDGATEWEMFWKITLPMTAPIMLLAIVYTIVTSFTKSSDIVDYITKLSFGTDIPQFAYSAALGWIYFIFVLLVILLVFLFMKPAIKRVA